MSAAPSLALEKTQRRALARRPLHVPLDVIALRCGVPEKLPGRCTDLSETGVGAVIAGELLPDQQVAIELRLPNVGVPVRARALVRYQSRLRCGLEFVGLSVEQREMIRYWLHRASAPVDIGDFKKEEKKRLQRRRRKRPWPLCRLPAESTKFVSCGAESTYCSRARWRWLLWDGGSGRGLGTIWRRTRRLQNRG